MPLTISTKCPSCGGALDFEEGTNAVHCGFCGSNHVVSGHGRVLSYYVPEKIPAARAVALALLKLKEKGVAGWRAREATLFFIPFYHFVGRVLRWEVEKVAIPGSGGDLERPGIGFGSFTSIKVFGSFGAGGDLSGLLSGGSVGSSTPIYEQRFELVSGSIDRSLPALGSALFKVQSLGIRPEVLKLSLFEKKAVLERGRLAPARLAASEVEEQGYAPVFEENNVARRAFNRMTSLIYFPFWAVEAAGPDGESVLAIVDGVGGDVPDTAAPMSLLDELLDKDGHGFEVVGFRPLKCPECAADLPVRPRDSVFFCSTCRKAWQISGDGLTETPYSVMPPLKKGPGIPEYFPFWVVRARMSSGSEVVDNKFGLTRLAPGISMPKEEDKKIPLRFFVPAFGIGNLKIFSRLASAYTRAQPVWEAQEAPDAQVRGATITPADALNVAPLITFSLIPKANKKALSFALDADVEALGAELVLVPFYQSRNDYLDGIFGLSVPSAALRD